MGERLRVLIVEGRFYDEIQDALLEGARTVLADCGADAEVVSVPGALEVPGAIAVAEAGGGWDGYVALGCVIRGETHHFEVVANESARGLMELTLRGLAVANGILTVEDGEQAWARARATEGDKGGAAARACLDMIALKRRFGAGE